MASKQFQKMKKAKVIKKDSQKIRIKFQNSITFNEFVFCQKRSKNKQILQHSKRPNGNLAIQLKSVISELGQLKQDLNCCF